MESEKQNQPPQQFGMRAEGLQRLRDAAPAMRLTLTLLGRDSWAWPVYGGSDGRLYVDVEPRADRQPKICTKLDNAFDGEPDTPVHADFTFVPRRDTW